MASIIIDLLRLSYASDGFTLGLIHDPRFVEVRKFGDGTLRPLWKKTEASNDGHLVHS